MISDIEEIFKKHYRQMIKSGFHEIDEDIPTKMYGFGEFREAVKSMRRSQLILMAIGELIEAQEADRKNNYYKLPRVVKKGVGLCGFEEKWNERVLKLNDHDFKIYFENHIKDTFEAEIADAILRIGDLSTLMGIDILFFINAVLRHNSLREKKHGKKY